MEERHLVSSSPAQQEDSWTCQRCGWIYPNAHPSAKHRRNHKKHCGKIKGFELHSELHKGGSSDEASSDDGKVSLQHQHSNQHDTATPVEPSSKDVVIEFPNALQSRELPLPENDSNVIQLETPVPHTTSDSFIVEPEASAKIHTQNLDSTDVAKSECSPDEHESTIDPCGKILKMAIDERDAKIQVPKEHDDVALVLDARGSPISDSSKVSPDQANLVLERESLLESPPKHAGSMLSVNDLSQTSGKKDGGNLPQHETDSDQALKVKEEIISNPAEHPVSHEAKGNMSLGHKPSTAQVEADGVGVLPLIGGTEKYIQDSQMSDSDQLKDAQKREIMNPVGHSISHEGSSQDDDSWTCRHCGWVYPGPPSNAKQRRNHKRHCGKLKGFEVQNVPQEGGSSDDISSDEEKKEHIQHDKHEFSNQPNGMTTMGAQTLLDDQSGDLIAASAQDSSTGAEETVPEHREEENEGAVHQDRLLPHNFEEPEISQSQREIPSIQETASEKQLSALPLLAQSEELHSSEKASSSAPESIPNVRDASHELKGDSRPIIDELSALNMPPSDGHPPDVDFNKSEGRGEGAVLTRNEHPIDSMSANEGLEPSGETGGHQNAHLREDQEPAKQHGLAGETLNCKSPDDAHPELGTRNSPEKLLDGSILVKDTGLPLVSASGADNLSVENDSERKNVMTEEATSHLPAEVWLKDDMSGLINDGSENADRSSEGNIVTLKATLMPIDSTSSVVKPFSGKTGIIEDTQGEGNPNGKPPTMTVGLARVPDSLPSDESSLTTSVKDQVPSLIERGQDETCHNKLDESPQMAEMQAQNLGRKQIEEKSEQSKTGATDERSTLATIESKPEAVTERESSMLVGDTLPASTIVKMGYDSGLSRSSLESESNQLSLVKKIDGKEDTESSLLVGDTLTPSAIVSMANDSGLSGASKVIDLDQQCAAKEGDEEKTRQVSAPAERLEKQEGASVGSSDRSLNSFTIADSEFSQCSDLAVLSQQFSDSLENFVDAADTLDACSVGGSVEESEGLDETQVAGVGEDLKPLGAASLDEKRNAKPDVLNGTTDLQMEKLSAGNTKEAVTEEKSRAIPGGTSYSFSSRREELKAPSPEAWQEPGPSSLKKKAEKWPTSEVIEDRKRSESHSALRRLMAEEEKDKVDDAVPKSSVARDASTSSVVQEASSANGKTPKSKSRSFWSHCICCPAVH